MLPSDQLPNGFTKQQIGRAITSKRLDLTILPTEKCNFRCTYCYETFENGKMTNETVEGVCNLISRRSANLTECSIGWFGGEPLLGLSVMRTILAHANKLANEHSFNLNSSITTNAYQLDYALFEELVNLNVTFYQISLDGWQEQHDKTRIRADGVGTFDKIWANLLSYRALKKPFNVQLRVHVSNENVGSLEILCRHIRESFGEDERFSVDFQDVRDMGGVNGAAITQVPKDTFATIKARLAAILYPNNAALEAKVAMISTKVGESSSRQSAEDAALGDNYICYAAKPNHWLIRSTGRVGKCTVFLDDDRNDIGTLHQDGTMTLSNVKASKWYQGFEDYSIEKMGCPVHFIDVDDIQSRRVSVVSEADRKLTMSINS